MRFSFHCFLKAHKGRKSTHFEKHQIDGLTQCATSGRSTLTTSRCRTSRSCPRTFGKYKKQRRLMVQSKWDEWNLLHWPSQSVHSWPPTAVTTLTKISQHLYSFKWFFSWSLFSTCKNHSFKLGHTSKACVSGGRIRFMALIPVSWHKTVASKKQRSRGPNEHQRSNGWGRVNPTRAWAYVLIWRIVVHSLCCTCRSYFQNCSNHLRQLWNLEKGEWCDAMELFIFGIVRRWYNTWEYMIRNVMYMNIHMIHSM